MADRIVVNTGPLIVLSKINALHVAEQLPYEFISPEEVREELDEGEKVGYNRVDPGWLHVIRLRQPLRQYELATLGKGEAAVIELAIELGVDKVCIDEWKGRRAALTAGLNVVGVLGLLGRAKKLGIISEVRPFIESALRAGVWYESSLVSRVLREVGEVWAP